MINMSKLIKLIKFEDLKKDFQRRARERGRTE